MLHFRFLKKHLWLLRSRHMAVETSQGNVPQLRSPWQPAITGAWRRWVKDPGGLVVSPACLLVFWGITSERRCSSILQWTSPHWYTINKANFKNYLGSLIAKKAWAARLKTFIIMMNSNMKDAVQSEFDLEASPNDWSGQVTYHGSTWNSLKKKFSRY